MNRYLVRSLVAVMAFLIGLAVSAAFKPAVKYRYRDRDCPKKSGYTYRHHGYRSSFRTPSVLVDTVLTDPLKLAYSNTSNNATYAGQQRVEFTALNQGKKNIESYTVSYLTGFPHQKGVASGSVTMDNIGGLRSGLDETVSVDCNPRETLTVWVSSVQFTDGSRWTNPRH